MSSPAPLQAVCFDAAGTLFEVRGSVGEIYARYASRYRREVSPEELEARFGVAFRQQPVLAFPPGTPEPELLAYEKAWWRELVTAVFAGHREWPTFDHYFDEVFEFFRTAQAWRALPEAAPTLAALKARGLKLALISNFDSRVFDVLRALNLEHFFDIIQISSRTGAAKPSPVIFQAALAALGVAPDRALHVGDSWCDDVRGALRAGLQAAWYAPSAVRLADNHPAVLQLSRLDQLVARLR